MPKTLPLVALLLLSACTTWRPLALPQPTDTVFSPGTTLRVTDSSGRVHTGVRGTLRGGVLRLTRVDGTPDSVPHAAIRSAELGVMDDRRSFMTTALLLGSAIGFVVWLTVAGFNTT